MAKQWKYRYDADGNPIGDYGSIGIDPNDTFEQVDDPISSAGPVGSQPGPDTVVDRSNPNPRQSPSVPMNRTMNAARRNPDNPSPPTSSNEPVGPPQPANPAYDANKFKQDLTALYQKYYRRDPTAAELAAHRNNPGGLAAIEQMLAATPNQSQEPQAGPGGPGGPGKKWSGKYGAEDLDDWIAEQAKVEGVNPSVGSDPAYWHRRIMETGGFQNAENAAYWAKLMMRKEGAPEGGGPGGGPGGGGYDLASYLTNSPLLRPWTAPFNFQPFGRATGEPAPYQPPAPFTAPTDVTEKNDPGYQFRLKQAQLAMERGASAKGSLLTGGTLRDLNDYIQNAASGEYSNVYNRSLQDWTTNYNKGLTDYQTQYNASLGDWTTNYNAANQQYQQAYNIFENNQAKQYNRISNLAGLGQTAAGQLGQQGLGYSQLNSQGLGNLGLNLGNLYTGIGNAQAAGGIANANIYGNMFGNLANLGSSTLGGMYGNRNPYGSSYGGTGPGTATPGPTNSYG